MTGTTNATIKTRGGKEIDKNEERKIQVTEKNSRNVEKL